MQLIHLSGSLSLSLPVACVHLCVPTLSSVSAGKVTGGQAPHRPDAVLLTVPTAGPEPGPKDHTGRRRRSTSADRVSLRGDLVTVKEKE